MCVVYDWSLTEARHPLFISEGLKCPSEKLKCPNLGQSLDWCWWTCSSWQPSSQVSISLFQCFYSLFPSHSPLPPAILLLREVLWSSCARSQASGCIVSPSITIHLTAILSALPKTHSLVLSHPPRQGAMQSKSQPLEPRRAWISMDKPKRQTMDHLEQHTLCDRDWFGEVDTVCGLHDSVRPSLCCAAWWTCNSEGN